MHLNEATYLPEQLMREGARTGTGNPIRCDPDGQGGWYVWYRKEVDVHPDDCIYWPGGTQVPPRYGIAHFTRRDEEFVLGVLEGTSDPSPRATRVHESLSAALEDLRREIGLR
jgi:hypothetical protein